jgi:membrane associated rhomboid family serine protease
MTFFALIALGLLAYAAAPPEVRSRAGSSVVDIFQRLSIDASASGGVVRAAMREHTPHATLALAALHVALFVAMLFGRGSLGDPATLVAWGASVGPRTTNGEWWRLLSAPFVHGGFWSLLAQVAALVWVGWTLERLVGPFTFAATYATASIAAGVAALAVAPLGVTYGSLGLLFGLFVARLAVRSAEASRYIHASGSRILVSGLGFVMLAETGGAYALRGISDIRPELQRLSDIERQTSAAYDAEVGRFKSGAIGTGTLARTIDDSIVPELQAADERIRSVTGVPPEDRHLVFDAREYIRERIESWQLRAQGLRESAQAGAVDARDAAAYRDRVSARHRLASLTLGRAESAQRSALETLQRVAIQ